MKLAELAQKLNAVLDGPGDIEISGVAGIGDATDGDVTYLADPKRFKDLEVCKASAVIVPQNMPPGQIPLPSLVVRNPRLAFAVVLGLFYVKAEEPAGIDDRAYIAKGAVLGDEVTIHPFVVIREGARIGSRVTVFPGTSIGKNATIGDDCVIHSNVSIYHGVTVGNRVIIHAGTVIGSDGFGFVTDTGVHHKIPQVGGVLIEDDVEIGGNCTIDRATLGSTVIKRGTKMDNQVHIAHNVTIGEHCLLAGQVGIAGSTTLGNYVVIGGQAGVGDHRKIGDRVMIGGGAAVTRDVDAGQVIAGHNAMPIREWLKVQAVLPKLPELRKAIQQIEQRIAELETNRKPSF